MNTRLIIAATIAGLSLATTAFAGEGGEGQGDPFPYRFSFPSVAVGGPANATADQDGYARVPAQHAGRLDQPKVSRPNG